MKNMNFFYSLVLCCTGLLIAAEPQQDMLARILREQPIRETLLSYVPPRAIGRLSRVSRGVGKAIASAIEPAIEKVAILESIWESQIHNARDLDLGGQRQNMDNQTFKSYVVQRIKDFAANSPGTWIKLNLWFNNLGNDLTFLGDLLQAIVATVKALKIDLAALNLTNNQLEELPEQLFDGLNNLVLIELGGNKLVNLPDHIFEGLNNLRTLGLSFNQLGNLPDHLFDGLNNLQSLILSNNKLEHLPAPLCGASHKLQKLDLSYNKLLNLPERTFGGLDNLGWLNLDMNQLVSLPEHLFEGLNSLQTLLMYRNQLTLLPEQLFKGLNSLKQISLSNNQLVNVNKSFFEGLSNLNNLESVSLCHNRFNNESIRLLQDFQLLQTFRRRKIFVER